MNCGTGRFYIIAHKLINDLPVCEEMESIKEEGHVKEILKQNRKFFDSPL